jgi:hypothetical protein
MKSKTAFTKRDLIVVIGIAIFLLANLGAIGGSGRRRAKEAVCLSNLRQWGTVFSMYLGDNEGFFNRGWPPAAGNESWGFAGGHHWPVELLPYYGDRKLRFCPVATRSLCVEGRAALWAWIRMDTINPERYCEPEGSYGTNEWTGNQPEESQRIPGANWRTANVTGADNIPLIMDCAWAGGFPQDLHDPPLYEGEMDLAEPEMRRFCINRHNGCVNIAFLDFSARKVGLKELWELKWHRYYDTCGPWTKCGGVQPEDWPDWMRDFKDY